ncbi:MAG: aromatic ring-hydroxylating dioxygenase subunit alpha [Lysobacteraceae bacterium]
MALAGRVPAARAVSGRPDALVEGVLLNPAAELDASPALREHWYAVCRSSDLGARRPLGLQLFDHPLVAFRDAQGRAAVLEDRCAHRHAPLSAGRVCAGKLRCPYHGWQYDGMGRVTQVPALGEHVQPSDELRGVCYRTQEQDGLLWVWPGAGVPAAVPRIATVGEPGWTRFIMKTRFRAGVEACLENFLDCPHATFVHRGWFRSPTGKPVRATVSMLDDGAVAEYFEEPRKRSVIWAMFAPPASTMRHTDRFIAPATSCVDYVFSDGRAYNITSTCCPLVDGAVEVFTVMSFRFPLWGPLVRLAFEPVSRWIIRQDVRMLDMVADNQRRFPPRRTLSTRADLLGPAIRGWRRALAERRTPPAAGECREVSLVL